jgi:hypothetical protein
MKNKLFLAGIILILIFAIIGLGCDGGGSLGGGSGGGSLGGGSGGGNGGSGGSSGSNGGSGGSGGSGSGNGGYDDDSGGSGSGNGDYDDGYDGSSGGSGSGSRDPNYNNGSGILFISGSGKSRSYYTVKFMVTTSDPSSPVDITYSYPRNDSYSWSSGSSAMYTDTASSVTEFPWEYTVSISSKVIGNGVLLSARSTEDVLQGDASQIPTLTARIFIDGKQRKIGSGQGYVFIDWR